MSIIRKVKLKNEKNGDVFLDYGRVTEPSAFRYHVLKSILRSVATDATLIVDTNMRTGEQHAPFDEGLLRWMGLPYVIVPAKANPSMFFGIQLSHRFGTKIEWPEQRIIVDLAGTELPEELFKAIKKYDLAIGFGRKLPFEEICQVCRGDGADMLFNRVFFMDSLYDSAICARLRSTFKLEQFLKAADDEMAL